MKKGKLATILLTQNTNLNFIDLSNGIGISHLTIENIGEAVLLIDDVSQQKIFTNEVFVIESPLPLINQNFGIRFLGKNPKAIIRYIVEIDCEC